MDNSSSHKGRAVVFLFLQSLSQALFYYFFVSVIAKSYGPELIGEAAAALSLSGFVSSLVTLGIYSGLSKTLGESLGNKDDNTAKNLVSSSILILLITTVSSIILLLSVPVIQTQTKLPISLLVVSAGIIPVLVYAGLAKIILTSMLRGRTIFLSSVTSGVAGLVVGFILLNNGYGSIAMAIGIAIINSIPALLILKTVWRWIEPNFFSKNVYHYATKILIRPSISSWIPNVLGVAGLQIGTLVIYAGQGSADAGIFFMSYAIYSVVLFVNYAFNNVTLPVISGMSHGREQYAIEAVRMQFVILAPLVIAGVIFAEQILSIFGTQYTQGKEVLQILLLSIFPQTIASGLRQLFYANGKNKHILLSGLISDGLRVILLFVLVHYFGSIGGALSITVGSIVAMVYYLVLTKRYQVNLPSLKILMSLAIPSALGILFYYYGIPYVVGLILLILLSLVVYIRLQLLTKNDITNIVNTTTPSKYASRIQISCHMLIDIILSAGARRVKS